MKSQILLSTAAVMLAMSLFGVGCAKKNSDSAPETPAPTATPTPAPGDSRAPAPGLSYGYGATTGFTPVNLAVMNTYVATHPLNAPKNFRLNVNLSEIHDNMYAGTIQISYFDNGQYFNGYFSSGSGTAVNTYRYNGKSEAEFNNWFIRASDNKQVFHGFFQDKWGAIILVVDDSLDSGDGGMPTEVSGSIWFKNFAPAQTGANQSPAKCWFIEIGPYDCRTFINGDNTVQSDLALEPSTNDGYEKLGTFTGLDAKKAFGF